MFSSWFCWKSCTWSVLWPMCVDRTALSWPAFCSGYSDTRTWRRSCSESSMTVRSALKVLLLFLFLCCMPEWIRIIHRVAFPDEATTLFRATTLASTLMEQYMKATATPFVHHALKDTILKIMESRQSCEVLLRLQIIMLKYPYPPFVALSFFLIMLD